MDRWHWFARLMDKDGGLVQVVPVPESIPASSIPGFLEFDDGNERFHPAPADLVQDKMRQFNRGKTVRKDDKITVVEYVEAP